MTYWTKATHWTKTEDLILFGLYATSKLKGNELLRTIRDTLISYGYPKRSVAALATRISNKRWELPHSFNSWLRKRGIEFEKFQNEQRNELYEQIMLTDNRKKKFEEYFTKPEIDPSGHAPVKEPESDSFVQVNYEDDGKLYLHVHLTSEYPTVILTVSTKTQES